MLQSSFYHDMLDLAVYTIFSGPGDAMAINARWLLGGLSLLHLS